MDKPKKKEVMSYDGLSLNDCIKYVGDIEGAKGYNQAITDYEAYLQDFLEDITGTCVDYDGYKTVKGLKGLIDDIKNYSIKRLGKND